MTGEDQRQHDMHVGRLTALEAIVGSLTSDVKDLVGVVRQQGDQNQEQFTFLHAEIAKHREPKWQLIMSVGLAAVVGLGAAQTPLYINGHYRDEDISRIGAENERLEAMFTGHYMAEGHPVALEKHKSTQAQLAELKNELDATQKMTMMSLGQEATIADLKSKLENYRFNSARRKVPTGDSEGEP